MRFLTQNSIDCIVLSISYTVPVIIEKDTERNGFTKNSTRKIKNKILTYIVCKSKICKGFKFMMLR